jgi:hypothetical protein
MKRKNALLWLICVVLVTGCASVGHRSALVDGRVISNPSLGFSGFSFEIPEGFDLYNPAVGTSEQYGEIQQLSIRIYNLNRAYHPRGNETFYDSFLMLSENTGVLLMTLKYDSMDPLSRGFFGDEVVSQVDLIPLYNVSGRDVFELGKNKAEAICTRGHAYEHKGWYYAGSRRKRSRFHYEACKVRGSRRDGYVLMGFCLPDHQDALNLQMKTLMQKLDF